MQKNFLNTLLNAITAIVTSLDQTLKHFRATHQPIQRRLAGADWRYFRAGAGDATLLMLPGAPGLAEMAFQYVLAFAPHWQVLAPSYPPSITDRSQLIAGLFEMLAAERCERVHVVGGSYSGLVAQYLVGQHPERFATLLLGDTGLPRARRGQIIQAAMALVRRLPAFGLHTALRLALLPVIRGESVEHDFWRRYLNAVISATSPAEFANRVRVWVDMDAGEQGAWRSLPIWRGPTLLVETVDDPLFSPDERAGLRARYPHARIHSFNVPGHTTALTHAEDYIRLILDFLQ